MSVALDSAGNAWLVGNTLSTDFPTTSDATQRTYAGDLADTKFHTGDALVTQVDPTGRTLRFSTYLGGCGGDLASAVSLDPTGSVFGAGGTSSRNLPVTQSATPS